MCGRYTLTVTGKVLADLFGLEETPELAPRYNIAPTQPAPIVRREGDRRRLRLLRWGLIPSWADDPAIGNRLINARAETAAAKPSFRSALRRRRCLVAGDGFYEWRREAGGKQPYLIRFEDGRPFAMGGLWETWRDPSGRSIDSFVILTTAPNEVVTPLHDRMPVIVPPEAFGLWLDPAVTDPATIAPLLAPPPADGLVARPVSRLVNDPANDVPACTLPIENAGWASPR